MNLLKQYVEAFNRDDEEIYQNKIDNAHALAWLSDEIPRFECPDKSLERTYYFRWWTYRKHLRETPEGYVITEFLPTVPWSGKYNMITCPFGHHLAEGRWMKHAKTYLSDYIRILLTDKEHLHNYSTWLIDAIYEYYQVIGDMPRDKKLVNTLCEYYETWESGHRLPNGMFWSYDDRDGMEFSISGNRGMQAKKGIRPTLNCYLCADALALAKLAEQAGMPEVALTYQQKHIALKKLINERLWNQDFFQAFHYEGENADEAFLCDRDAIPRELIGYLPWYFGISEHDPQAPFARLADPNSFFTEFGLTTAEQTHPRFLYEAEHECLWNGYIWPFATSQVLTALLRVCREKPQERAYQTLFYNLLKQYADSHTITLPNGKVQPWIDEVKHPRSGDWSSRTILKNWGWKAEKGGYERGKDYNHSTFCDLVIRGIAGVRTDTDRFTLQPIIPEDWDYFKLENLSFRGDTYDIFYDKNGARYHKGVGLNVYRNGVKIG